MAAGASVKRSRFRALHEQGASSSQSWDPGGAQGWRGLVSRRWQQPAPATRGPSAVKTAN